MSDKEIAPGKGKKGQNCNRTSCQEPGATHQHRDNGFYYCTWCARDIGDFALRADERDLFPGLPDKDLGARALAARERIKAKQIAAAS